MQFRATNLLMSEVFLTESAQSSIYSFKSLSSSINILLHHENNERKEIEMFAENNTRKISWKKKLFD